MLSGYGGARALLCRDHIYTSVACMYDRDRNYTVIGPTRSIVRDRFTEWP